LKHKVIWFLINFLILVNYIIRLPFYLKLNILCIRYIYRNKQGLKAFRSFYFKFGKYLLLKHSKKDVNVLLDEGVVHTIQSIFIKYSNKFKKNEIIYYLKNIPLPDILVVLYNREQLVLEKRILKRGHHRLTTGSNSDIKKFIENSVSAEDIIINNLIKKNNTEFKSFDSVCGKLYFIKIFHY